MLFGFIYVPFRGIDGSFREMISSFLKPETRSVFFYSKEQYYRMNEKLYEVERCLWIIHGFISTLVESGL